MDTTPTRQEHLSWCKQRALEHIDLGDLSGAFYSFASDVSKHPETENIRDIIANLGMPLLMSGNLGTPNKMRTYIEDYN